MSSGSQSDSKCHEAHMRTAVGLADSAVARGDHPFGALFVDTAAAAADGGKVVLEAMNSVHTHSDITNHAELNLLRLIQKPENKALFKRISELTLYTSTEPCAMCAGAMWWVGVRRFVYGCSEKRLSEIVDMNEKLLGGNLNAQSRDVLGNADATVEIIGPVLEDVAAKSHEAYWCKL
jgi:tRNA(Arg) A34 adenosine deaminase TadA